MKKILIILLLFIMCLCTFGLTACGDGSSANNDNRDANIVAVYNTYVDYVQSNGQTPLSYEDWLASIKGEKGDTPVIEIINGDWYIDGVNTGVKAEGKDGFTPCTHSSESDWIVLIEASCTQTGLKQTICDDCGKVLQTEQIAKLSHTESEWIIDEQANCKDSGLKHKECLDCGAVLIVSSVNTEYNHNYIYGECQLCGDIDSSYMTEGLVYSLINNDTEYEVVGYAGSSTNVIIPAIYKGKPVTSIGDDAFLDCYSLTSIEIPNSVTSMGEAAFCCCYSLTSIEIPNSVTSIGESAFAYCDSLTYNIKDGLKYLGNSSNPYLYLADTVGTSITTATIDSNCRFIGEYAFSDCDSLTSITIPNSVTSIGDYAFRSCTSLTSIEIPDSVTSIGEHAFSYCDSLTIYCQATEKPSGWDSGWNYSNCPVVWGYNGEN